MHCSDLERYLEACLDGQLGDSRRQALKDHLALCGSCRERIDSLRRFEAELQRRLRSMQHEASLWQPLGLGAVVLPAAGPQSGPQSGPLAFGPLPASAAKPGATAASAGSGTGSAAAAGATGRAAPQRGHRLRIARGAKAAAVHPAVGRRLQSLAGVALVVAAVAAVVDLTLAGLGWLARDGRAEVYRAYVDGGVLLDLRTAEAARLSAWLGEQLGAPVTLPATPGGFALVGGSMAPDGLPEKAAVAVYASAGGPALLVIEAKEGDAAPVALETGGAVAPAVQLENGLARLDWQEGGHRYSLIGALPPEKLALFAD
jgi:anti-sigma factor RsiW